MVLREYVELPAIILPYDFHSSLFAWPTLGIRSFIPVCSFGLRFISASGLGSNHYSKSIAPSYTRSPLPLRSSSNSVSRVSVTHRTLSGSGCSTYLNHTPHLTYHRITVRDPPHSANPPTPPPSLLPSRTSHLSAPHKSTALPPPEQHHHGFHSKHTIHNSTPRATLFTGNDSDCQTRDTT
ncbi:hypothetical protein BZA77DRAFT_37112 [Pyronema omphalodes]|nr:hypothetical protein BZA77DRAFT_37112 [Pyronema omphalodes]